MGENPEITSKDYLSLSGAKSQGIKQFMAQMGKDKPITFKNLERICKALSCTPNDIISFEDEFEKEI